MKCGQDTKLTPTLSDVDTQYIETESDKGRVRISYSGVCESSILDHSSINRSL